MFLSAQVDVVQKVSISEHKQQESVATLRKMTSVDIDDFMEWATDDEVTKYMMWNSYTSREEAERFFQEVVEKHAWFRVICIDKKVVGSITLDKGKGAHSCKAELGYVLSRKYWGKGIATQAIKIALHSGFNDLDVERIEAFVDPSNVASQRVLEKNGLEKEGLLKNYIIQKGVVRDRVVYALAKPVSKKSL